MEDSLKKILIIEDSRSAAALIAKVLSENDFKSIICSDYREASEALPQQDFFAAIVDMNLPDSDWEKTTLLVSKYDVPIIIYSSEEYNTGLREKVLDKTILDYISKQDEQGLKKLGKILVRLRKNSFMKVLIADDSESALSLAASILERAKFQVFTAKNGKRAAAIVDQNKDISIVLTDYEMPEMDGFELLKFIRKRYDSNSLAVIAISHPSTKASISRFLKYGANDFILKPYTNDELYCRVANHAELVESYKQVSRLNQEKNYLLGMTSHDIRGPLGSVVGLCNTMLEDSGYTDPVLVKETLKLISESSENILSMVNSLLDVSSIESDKFELKPGQASITELIKERLNLIFYKNASMKNIAISYEPGSDIEFTFDKTRLTQVIDNLISNAIKFTPLAGTIDIEVYKEDDEVIFKIRDNGPGFSEEDMKNVFKRFRPLSAAPTNGEKSIGLGLSICKKIVNLHKGSIGVKNLPQGGAEFYFTIPAV